MWEERESELVARIRKSLYVDDVITVAPTVQQTQKQKEKATKIFSDALFTLHKWESNAAELEQPAELHHNEEQSFAKQQLGTKTTETKLLGLPWDPNADTLSVCFPQEKEETTKRGKPMASSSLNPVDPAFRPTRAAAATANELIQGNARF